MLDLQQGQRFEENRGSLVSYELEYCNQDIVLLRYGTGNHRLEDREEFEERVESGYFDALQPVTESTDNPSESSESDSKEVPFEDIAWVGESSAESLRDSGLTTARDIERVSDERLLDCDSVGETAVENIREWVDNDE